MAADKVLDDTALAEICQPESVSWALCGAQVSIGWVRRDLVIQAAEDPEQDQSRGGGTVRTHEWHDTTGHVIVCNGAKRQSAITMYYPCLLYTSPSPRD